MADTEVCRLCAVLVNVSNSNKLFLRCRRRLLQQIEELTGLKLEYTRDLPHLICETCQTQTRQAHKFRSRCIQVQQQLTTAQYLNQIKEFHNAEEKVICTEVNIAAEETDSDEEHHKDVYEQAEVEDVLLPIAEVLLKQENTDDTNFEENTASTGDYSHDLDADTESKSVLRTRKKPNRRTRDYICDHCGKTCTNSTNFARHQQRHGDRQFQCEFCTAKFFTKPDLKSHVRVHTGEKPYTCRHCGKCFGNSTSKSVHERIHTKECPFVCQWCGKSFRSSAKIHRHILTHTGQRPSDKQESQGVLPLLDAKTARGKTTKKIITIKRIQQ